MRERASGSTIARAKTIVATRRKREQPGGRAAWSSTQEPCREESRGTSHFGKAGRATEPIRHKTILFAQYKRSPMHVTQNNPLNGRRISINRACGVRWWACTSTGG